MGITAHTSSIARAFADAESSSPPSSCKCRGCVAQRRRIVVATLAAALVGASLVKRQHYPGHMVFPLGCLTGGVVDRTSKTAHCELQRDYACLSMHRVVQEVVRVGHATRLKSSPRSVVLAWRASVTCGDEVATGAVTTETALCGDHWTPAVAVRQVMAARHVAATAPHIDLADATLAVAMPSSDARSPCVELLRRVCQLAAILCKYSELRGALIICEWVGCETRRGSGLWDTCV